MAVAAKDPPGAQGFSLGAAFVISAQAAMPNQRADHFAVRTRPMLEPLGNRVPFRGVAEKPSLVAHEPASAKIVILPALARGGVKAGYERSPWAGRGVKTLGAHQIPGVINSRRSDGNSATFTSKCDQSGVRDNHAE